MAQTIKRPFKTFNGVDWDKHYFETSEDMIVGFLPQNITDNGYKKFPGGLIVQWGVKYFNISNGFEMGRVDYPIAFPTQCYAVIPGYRANGHDQWKITDPLLVRYDLITDNTKHFNWSTNINTQGETNPSSMYVSWVAVGK